MVEKINMKDAGKQLNCPLVTWLAVKAIWKINAQAWRDYFRAGSIIN